MNTPPRYPKTPHWPQSEKLHRDDTYLNDPSAFVGVPVVVTEKMDGGNTCLFNGEVYARSVASPAQDKWFAMVKKHHGWKTTQSPDYRNVAFYGEDIYGVHSIEYGHIPENETFMLFAVHYPDSLWEGGWDSWQDVMRAATIFDMKTVPIVDRCVFRSEEDITKFFQNEISKPSALGGPREGFVMRHESIFAGDQFRERVCKYVRANHVQTDQHWRRNWKPCKLTSEIE
jgi:hypothetical protein